MNDYCCDPTQYYTPAWVTVSVMCMCLIVINSDYHNRNVSVLGMINNLLWPGIQQSH